VKRAFILMPMMLPRISDQAAVHLLDILEQLLACVRHHYEPQIHRWQRLSIPGPCPRPAFAKKQVRCCATRRTAAPS
jgi:hypothetical protein